MIFNSLTFLVFLPIVFGLYWFVCGRDVRGQNALLVAADSAIRADPMEGRNLMRNVASLATK